MNCSSYEHAATPASACPPPSQTIQNGHRRRRPPRICKRYSSTCSDSGKRPNERRPRRVRKQCRNKTDGKMGCTSSRKNAEKDSDDNEVWKKRDDVRNITNETRKRKNKKKKKEKNRNDAVIKQEIPHEHDHPNEISFKEQINVNDRNVTSVCPVYATPNRRHKDVFANTGIKMADESSSSGHSCATPTTTPTTRRAHPVFKVTTPPPPRRALPPDFTQSAVPRANSPPSPPPRNPNFGSTKQVPNNNEGIAPELPPRRNREHSKISSPSLSRKNNECIVSKLPTPIIMRQHEESPKSSPCISKKIDKPVSPTKTVKTKAPKVESSAVLVTTSPVLMRKTGRIEFINTSSPILKRKYGNNCENGHIKQKDNEPPPLSKPSPILVRKIQAELKDSPRTARKNYNRAPTPPPRLARSDSKPESPDVGSSTTQRVHPVFKVSTPPSSRKELSDTNSSLTSKYEKKDEISSQHKEENNVTCSTNRANYLKEPFRECEPMKCETDRVLKREIKTLSMEIEEENMKNLMMEIKSKEGKIKSKEGKSSVATMNVLPGPILVKECTIPQPERAVISSPPPECTIFLPPESTNAVICGPPPPSPSSMDILEEEEEDMHETDYPGQKQVSKEVEEFGDSVCQRLSILLESKDVVYEQDANDDYNNLTVKYDKEVADDTEKGRPEPVSEVPDFEKTSQELSHKINEVNEPSPALGNEMKLVGFNYRNYAHELNSIKRLHHQYEVPIEFRDSYDPQKDISKVKGNLPVQEDQIVPKEIKRKSLIENLQPLRGSDILCEIINAYSDPEMKQKQEVVQGSLVSRENVELRTELPTIETKQPSRLDQSLQKIFKMPNTDETYNELLPLENFLEDVLDASPEAENYYPTFDSSDVLFVKRCRHIGGRQSMTRTESDIDISEPGDDMSTGSMLADDEDEIGSGEILFSKEYPDNRQEGEVTNHCRRQDERSRDRYDDDDNYWDDEDDEDYDRYSAEESEELSSEEDEYYNEYIDQDIRAEEDTFADLSQEKNPTDLYVGKDEQNHIGTNNNACAVSDYENDHQIFEAASLQHTQEPEVLYNPSCDTELRHSHRDDLHFDFLTFQPHSTLDAGDIAYDSARRQMNEIHEHLQNLRDQMEQLAQECECEGHNLRPSLVLEADADVKHRRKSKDRTE